MRIFLFACGSPTVAPDASHAVVTAWHYHSDHMLGDNLAHRWRKLGHEVCNYPDERYVGTKIAEYFDAVFLYHLVRGTEWDRLCPDWPYGRKPAMCWLHSCPSTEVEHAWRPTENIMRKFDYLPTLHSLIKEDFAKRAPYGHLFVLPWPSFSMWEWPPTQPNPYAGEKPVILFCGCLRRHTLDLLNKLVEFLPECELHVISCNIYDPALQGELERTPSDMIPLSDLPPSVVYHQPMINGTFSQFFWYADIGLDVAAAANQRSANTKVMDYLAAGLPVVACGRAPGMEVVEDLGRLKVAEFGNAKQAADMIRETLAAGRQEPLRQLSRDHVRAHHSSNIVADTIIGLFENYSGSAATLSPIE